MTYYLLPRSNRNVYTKLSYERTENRIALSHTLAKYLYEIKEKITDIDKSWDIYKKYTNPYEYIHTNTPQTKRPISKYKPLSRSYFKMIEILHTFCILYETPIITFHLAGGIPGYRARIRPIVSRITIHWPSFYNVVTGKTLALPNLIALQHIPLSPAGVIAKRPAPIALPNSCAAEWRMAPDAVFSPYASVRYFTPHMVHSQYNLL